MMAPNSHHLIQISIPYLGLYNVQDFAQILYLVGGVHIINRNNVFHSFPDRGNHMSAMFFCIYYVLIKASYENANKTQYI